MISADQALQIVLENVAPLGVERVAILDALGRVLAEPISSSRDIPGFDNSAMDGYAVHAADVAKASEASPVKLAVVETVGAGQMPTRRVSAGQAVRTMTGAPIAEGADAIIPVERTRGGGDSVEFLASAEKGAFIRPRGEDLRLGESVISAGKTLTPADLGMLASVNRAMVEVIRRPRVAIVATGDELVDVDQPPTGAQVVNSSAYALAGAVREAGAEAVILKVARDDAREIRERLAEAMTFDAVLSTGGVSVGQFDHVKGALDELGMRQLFHGVAQKPGRPLKFGTVGYRPIFGLPGNPVSTLVCFYLYARPALLKMSGRQRVGLPRVNARCGVDIKTSKDLTEFVRVKLKRDADGWLATPTGGQGSGILSSLSRADGLLIGPSTEAILRAGAQATVLLLGADGGMGAVTADELFEGRNHSQ
ncbi:MAG TPA: gephyrin-like molybdotransferase Glp [Candidatus Binatus sp.]|uniref:molybdopterin molybdotransferase MoeA n=1 Tax=Candidatus Binatus sp. TaxID=2811406 RepID=UPI002F3FB3C0